MTKADADNLRRAARAVVNLIAQDSAHNVWAEWVPPDLRDLADRIDPPGCDHDGLTPEECPVCPEGLNS